MRGYQLDPHQPVGGVIAEDADQQIVQLNLQKGNEVPPRPAQPKTALRPLLRLTVFTPYCPAMRNNFKTIA